MSSAQGFVVCAHADDDPGIHRKTSHVDLYHVEDDLASFSLNLTFTDKEKLRAGTGPEDDTALPAGATAAQLREWADRMLRRRAAGAAQEGVAPSSGAASAAAEDVPEQAGMLGALKVRLMQVATVAVRRVPFLQPTLLELAITTE